MALDLPEQLHRHISVNNAFRAILSYLADSPDSTDTLEGVTHWWLLAEGAEWSRVEAQDAITQGVTEGLILAARGADGQIRYSLAPGKLSEIHQRLKPNPEK
jgi:hypothetical protein